jgi:hypothetical protein
MGANEEAGMTASEMTTEDGRVSQALFERACRIAAGDPGHTPQVDLTRPDRKSPDAAERASWQRKAA